METEQIYKRGQIKYYSQVFTCSTGKGERELWHLIAFPSFDKIDMFFDSKDEAIKYGEKNGVEVIDYKDN